MLRRNQQIAVRRPGIDAGEHGRRSLEDFIVPAHTNARQVFAFIDDACLSRRRLKHVVNGAQADRYANRSRRNSMTPRYELRHIRGSATITWRSHALVTVNWKSTPARLGREGVIQRDTSLVRLLVDKLAAYLVPASQLTDGLRPGQRENGQILALTLRQLRRHATALIHVHTTNEKSGCRHPPWGR
jgi:hypothetical protein